MPCGSSFYQIKCKITWAYCLIGLHLPAKSSLKILFLGNTRVVFLSSFKFLMKDFFVLGPFIFSENIFPVSIDFLKCLPVALNLCIYVFVEKSSVIILDSSTDIPQCHFLDSFFQKKNSPLRF